MTTLDLFDFYVVGAVATAAALLAWLTSEGRWSGGPAEVGGTAVALLLAAAAWPIYLVAVVAALVWGRSRGGWGP